MKLRAYLYALAGLVWAALPVVAQAALVPCGLSSDVNVGGSLSCDLCYAGQLLQNLINYGIGLSIPIAAGLFAWAGVLYMSARGNPAKIQEAHKIFRSVVVGFVLALGAWFIVQTFLQVVFKQDYFKNLGGNWTSLDCEEQRKAREQTTNKKISDVLGGNLPNPTIQGGGPVLGGYNSPTIGGSISGCSQGGTLTAEDICVRDDGYVYAAGTGGSSGYGNSSCPTGYVYTSEEGGYCQSNDASTPEAWTEACPRGYVYTQEEGGYCVDPSNPDRWVEQDGTGGSGASQTAASRSARSAEFNNQISSACTQLSVDCSIAGRIAANESSGGRNCTTSPTGAAGCMQVLATTACGIDSSISSACGACSASRQSLSPQCAPVIDAITSNQQLGVNLGVQYISNLQNMSALQTYRSQYGDCQVTAAAYYAGPGAVLDAFRSGGNINNVRVPAGAQSASQYVATACR